MTNRKAHSSDFKTKVALDAIREELTLSDLSKKYGEPAPQIWHLEAVGDQEYGDRHYQAWGRYRTGQANVRIFNDSQYKTDLML